MVNKPTLAQTAQRVYPKLPPGTRCLLNKQVDILTDEIKGLGRLTAIEILAVIGKLMVEEDDQTTTLLHQPGSR
jgi:hypothetical protein